MLVVWLQLSVSGFRPVLARGWHGARLTMRTTGVRVVQVRCSKSVGCIGPAGYESSPPRCCTFMLHTGALTIKCQLARAHVPEAVGANAPSRLDHELIRSLDSTTSHRLCFVPSFAVPSFASSFVPSFAAAGATRLFDHYIPTAPTRLPAYGRAIRTESELSPR